ncbi:hypothetical protein JD969_08000 [Planctomycetota bacterium]|nr:hypothetical protein JD969_08000 [Planctomycetota bacterium]
MDLGPNTKHVQQVIDFVQNHGIFNRNKLIPSHLQNALITDIQQACDLATSQPFESDEVDWTDLRSSQISKIRGIANKSESLNQYRRNLKPLTHDFLESIASRVSLRVCSNFELISNEIHADLLLCAESRCIMGLDNPFFEALFECYQCGGWPCGWSGNYPNGNMLIYMPNHTSKCSTLPNTTYNIISQCLTSTINSKSIS